LVPTEMREAERRLKVLISAYACEPGRGSEPSVGWHVVMGMARHHDVWVITRANQRTAIDRELRQASGTSLELPRFCYVDLPARARFWKRGPIGIALYYYLWQILAYRDARALHRTIGFDLTHHVTFVKYSVPSLLVRLPLPFLWGPVAGGESAPRPFIRELGLRGRAAETARNLARALGELDPLVRATARRSALVLAATQETADRLQKLGARDVRVLSQVGASSDEIEALQSQCREAMPPFRLMSIGRLLEWKGFHLGLRAFAAARLVNAEYWIIGDGPARNRLEKLAKKLGVRDSVRFLGGLQRHHVLEQLSRCHLLVHPSLHDSGGWVCWEAMAAGCPVASLDLGGPAMQIDDASGFRVTATNPDRTVAELAECMAKLASDSALWELKSEAARRRVADTLGWDRKCDYISSLYRSIVGSAA